MENYGAHGGDIDESYEERAGGYTECDLQEPFSSLTVGKDHIGQSLTEITEISRASGKFCN